MPSHVECLHHPELVAACPDHALKHVNLHPRTGTSLATEFSQHINAAGLRTPLSHRSPTPMLSPTACIAAQMDALQINDWPEPDAGVRTAFLFSKPYGCEEIVAGQVCGACMPSLIMGGNACGGCVQFRNATGLPCTQHL